MKNNPKCLIILSYANVEERIMILMIKIIKIMTMTTDQ